MAQEEGKRKKQTSIQEWAKKDDGVEKNIPEGRKEEKIVFKPIQKRRMKGKLTKKEQAKMKRTHGDIALLLAPPPPVETRNHDKVMAREVEVMEVVDEEREERLERVRLITLEWMDKHAGRGILMELMEAAVLESE